MSTTDKALKIKKTRRRRLKRKLAYFFLPASLAVLLLIAGLAVIHFKGSYYSQVLDIMDSKADTLKLDSVYSGKSDVKSGEISNSDVRVPSVNQKYGEIICRRLGIKADLYYGDGIAVLKAGVGQHTGSSLPGYGSTILAAAHNSTYFSGLKNCEKGDEFTVLTSYGTFVYKAEDISVKKIKNEDTDENLDIIDLNSKEEKLVLYTCYPFEKMAGDSNKRLFVTCKKVSGPAVKGLEASDK